jgi:hypothetical protein
MYLIEIIGSCGEPEVRDKRRSAYERKAVPVTGRGDPYGGEFGSLTRLPAFLPPGRFLVLISVIG